MKKVFLQDVVPSGKRSIRNIPLPQTKASPREARIKEVKENTSTPEPTSEQKPPHTPPTRRNKSKNGMSRFYFWAGALVLVLALGYAASFMLVSARVTVTPKELTEQVTVAGTGALDAPQGTLGYTVVSLSKEAQKEIPATGQEKVEVKASGKIVIYNATKDAQKLIANTRFETPAGLIYRTRDAVTVPGQKTAGGTTAPGNLTVTVYADQAGDKYNIGLSDFTIPGFKDDPRYKTITAKSDPASPISGGYVGTVAKVSSNDAVTAKAAIETQLKTELKDALAAQIPDTHILFNNAYIFNFEALPQTPGANATTAIAKEKGTIYGILFEKNEISNFIAQKTADVSDKNVYVSNLESLTLTLDNPAAFTPTSKTLSFKLTGSPRFVWSVDAAAVAMGLADQKRANIKAILAKFEAIDRANVVIQPFWILSLPAKPERITVEVANN